MDIIVVKQPDDAYKISPFRIKFGSLRVLRAKEKIVNILINGQKCDLTMRLSECGEAYFMTEVKRVSSDLAYNSDGYSSPIELGKSAPSSPKIKINEMPTLSLEETTNCTLVVNQAYIERNAINNIDSVSINNREVKICFNEEYQGISKALTEFLINHDEIDKRSRKMSFDVYSRDENYYRFRISKQEGFSIESSSTQKSLKSMKIELSNSWNLMSRSKENLEEIFLNNKINKQEFFKDPWKILNNNNLAVRYEDNVYTWKVIAPIIVSQLAFEEQLPANVTTSLTQQQQGFFLWRKINLDAFKIEIKKKIENINMKSIIKSTELTTNSNTDSSKNSPNLDSLKQVDTRKQTVQYKKRYTLSTDQIKSLNLNPGKNEISFVVSSRYQGTHILTSDIYLWDWEDKILISDLDGTITRSDVLGQFFPFIGKDWSHKGVVRLFNDIDKNGYKIIYLTARAICQSTQTKNYLREKLIQSKYILKFFTKTI
jgi:phosphatidate phosphatase PAH1